MEKIDISQDDLTDIKELTLKLEKNIGKIYKENDRSIAQSVLIGGVINSLIRNSKDIEDISEFYNIFSQVLAMAIKSIKIIKK